MADHPCLYCAEPVRLNEPHQARPHINGDGVFVLAWWHRECVVRFEVGSVGHQTRRCPCWGGKEEDPPGMTKREAAMAAFIMARGGRKEGDA